MELREIIDSNRYMVLATAGADGRPWATPVWFAHRDHTEFIWVSRPDTRHSRNIAERPEIGLVIFDSTVPMGTGQGAYVEATAALVPEAGHGAALEAFSAESRAQGGGPWSVEDVTSGGPHRLYRAVATAHFVLDDRDQRVTVTL